MTNDKPDSPDLTIKILKLRPEDDPRLPLPRYMTAHASGMDLCADIRDDQVIEAATIAVIPTGIAIALPPGYEGEIRPRSGLAFKHGISIINSPGTIDSDYRGEIKIALINLGTKPYTVHRGDRIAQLVVQKVYRAKLEVVDRLEKTERDEGGFGHTGV
ncbi:MAG: dUTP diphosphatase [Deltaproteobacteria bacterium]|nr:MAG: dUTP diphosphatase [Deltaproteobacteria bacterium]